MGDGKAAEKYGVSTRTIRQWRTDAKETRPDVEAKAAANLQASLQEAHEDRVTARANKIDEAMDEAIAYLLWAAETRTKTPNPLMVQSLVSGIKVLAELRGGASGSDKTPNVFRIEVAPFRDPDGTISRPPDE